MAFDEVLKKKSQTERDTVREQRDLKGSSRIQQAGTPVSRPFNQKGGEFESDESCDPPGSCRNCDSINVLTNR